MVQETVSALPIFTADVYKPFDCDHCISEIISKNNNTILQTLPFPVECEDNIFGEPTETKRKPDISSMTTAELNKFVKQCKNIQNQFNPSVNVEEEEEFFDSMIDSDYYSVNKFNRLKPDKTSSFGVAHVNIASLDAHIDDLRTVLSRLKFSFDVIGISEHKIRQDSTSSNNIDITGYQKFDFEPTGTTHGGAVFYVKSNLVCKVRKDLNLNSQVILKPCSSK